MYLSHQVKSSIGRGAASKLLWLSPLPLALSGPSRQDIIPLEGYTNAARPSLSLALQQRRRVEHRTRWQARQIPCPPRRLTPTPSMSRSMATSRGPLSTPSTTPTRSCTPRRWPSTPTTRPSTGPRRSAWCAGWTFAYCLCWASATFSTCVLRLFVFFIRA